MKANKIWKKRTATSPSGRHLGHFHAFIRHFKAANDQKRELLEQKREDIIQVHFNMLFIAVIHEHVYNQWKLSLTCMIEKDIGSALVNRLQVIHLYGCDVNMLIGMFVRELDHHCEGNKLINEGTYGSRTNRRAIHLVIVDVTRTEVSMITRNILVRFNNDATACFNQILSHLLCLCLCTFGMPKKFTTVLGELLKQAKYTIKTSRGISKLTYSHSEDSPVFGGGQGSELTATKWVKLVPRALDLHGRLGKGSKYRDPEGLIEAIVKILSFVDNNNILNNGESWETVAQVL